jgi:hypothetical protein
MTSSLPQSPVVVSKHPAEEARAKVPNDVPTGQGRRFMLEMAGNIAPDIVSRARCAKGELP